MADKEAAESESDLPELDPKSEALIPLLRGEPESALPLPPRG